MNPISETVNALFVSSSHNAHYVLRVSLATMAPTATDMPWEQLKMQRPEAEEALHALGGEDGQFVVRGHKDPTKRSYY